jgi:hypothetical protein
MVDLRHIGRLRVGWRTTCTSISVLAFRENVIDV